MDKTGSTLTLAAKSIRRNFFQWAVKWFYASVPEDTSKKSDIPSIICLLQAVGFKLREFEKRRTSGNDEVKSRNIRITMECGSSKMTAVLEMDDVECECRDQNEANDGSLWSITGTGLMSSMDSVNTFEETGSNLLPEMSKETTAVVRDVVHRLIKLINNTRDDNKSADLNANSPPVKGVNTTTTKNADIKEGLVRSYTDFYDHKPRTAAKLNSNLVKAKCTSSSRSINDAGVPSEKPKLQRQGTYDLEENEDMEEPRSSPPKLAISPVFDQLCTSLGHISLQSEEEALSLADYVVKAHQILDKAMNFIIKKLPNQSPSQDDANFVKPAPPPPSMSSSFCSSSPRTVRINSIHTAANRTISNTSTRSSSSSSSNNSRVTPAATAANKSSIGQRSSLPARVIPPMRDRSSSFSTAQRPQSSFGTLAVQRRSSTNAIPRSTSANSKLPAANKINQTRGSTLDRPVLMAKRQSSDIRTQISSPALQSSQARGNTPPAAIAGLANRRSIPFITVPAAPASFPANPAVAASPPLTQLDVIVIGPPAAPAAPTG